MDTTTGLHWEDCLSDGDMNEVRDISDFYHVQTANLRINEHRDYELDREEDVIELYYENNMHKILAIDPKSADYQDIIMTVSDNLVYENIYKSSKHKNKAKYSEASKQYKRQ